ncbi:hypothetical protein ACF0H5_000970 [Mactra antiquata]
MMNMYENNTVVPSKTNDTSYGTELEDIRQPVFMIVIYSIAYGVIFLFALFGNIAVVIVVSRTRQLQSLTNFFIVNLAVADILVAVFCTPITLLQSLYNGWRYGAFLCKFLPYMQGVSVCASVNLLAAIAADRYLAICFTLEHKMTWKMGKILVTLIWLLSCCMLMPWLIYFKQKPVYENKNLLLYLCIEEWPVENGDKIFLLFIFIVCYIVPLVLITACYVMIAMRVCTRNAPGIYHYNNVIEKSKVKVIKMLALIVFMFGISWLPLYTVFIILSFDTQSDNWLRNFLINNLVPVAQWLAHSNSAINPVIYCFFSRTIRKRIVSMLVCTKPPNPGRKQSRFSSTRLMSVDYSNGQIILRLNKRRAAESNSNPSNNNLLVESTFYD